MSRSINRGFTTVELFITILVGMVFIGAMSQIYTVVISDSAEVRNRATASSIAYTQARTVLASLGGSCTTSTASATLSSVNLPGVVTQTTTVDCPYSATYGNNTIWRVTVTVSYGANSPQSEVKHVLYTY